VIDESLMYKLSEKQKTKKLWRPGLENITYNLSKSAEHPTEPSSPCFAEFLEIQK
jgi:hypothetical protein